MKPMASRKHARAPIAPWFALLGLLLVCSASVAATDAERISELEKKLEESLRLIQRLNERVQEMEGRATAAKAAASAPAQSAELDKKLIDLEQQVRSVANRPEPDRGLEMHGFADVGLVAASKSQHSGAAVGALDFYLAPRLGDRIRGLLELNFEANQQGETVVDLERIQLGYTISDSSTLWLGRFHTPFGYWNTAFHHGAQLQTSIKRPKFLEFEDQGGILPAHTVGVWLSGRQRTSPGRVGYDLYAGNGPSIQTTDPAAPNTGVLDPGIQGAFSRSVTVGGNLSLSVSPLDDALTFGVHGLTTEVKDTAAASNVTRVTVLGAWATYLTDKWEVMLEGYHFRNRDGSGGTGIHTSHAGYAQVGRLINRWTPYARYELTSLDQTDNYFAQLESGQSYRRAVLGLRFDFDPRSALKIEGARTRLVDRVIGSYSELRGQFAVRF